MKTIHRLAEIKKLLSHISFKLLGQILRLSVERDKKYKNGRVYIQVFYNAPCTKTRRIESFKGKKHYLSPHMTEDEIVKQAWVAFQAAVNHEMLEGFKFDDVIVFNPHTSFRELLKVSPKEVIREFTPNFDF